MPESLAGAIPDRDRGPSPPTDRVVAILDHLAHEPRRPSTVSELAKHLRISQATCHAIVTSLAESGYLLRAPGTKRYGLGPKLIGIGRATETALSVGHLVRSGLQELSATAGAACSVQSLSDDTILIVDIVGDGAVSGADAIGDRYPFAPPFGSSFVVWGADDVARRWLGRAPMKVPPAQRRLLQRLVASCRRRGYIVYPFGGLVGDLHRALLRSRDAQEPESEVIRRLRIEVLQHAWTVGTVLDDRVDELIDVATIGAPIFGADGSARFAVEFHLNRRELRITEVEEFAAQLTTVTEEATLASGGVDPYRRDADAS
jgi:DNA-binding IclR family transcriptional regulator